jgi:hypothetical protein
MEEDQVQDPPVKDPLGILHVKNTGGGDPLGILPKKTGGAGSPHDFTHGYKPTPQDLKTKQSFNDLESGFDKSSNGSDNSPGFRPVTKFTKGVSTDYSDHTSHIGSSSGSWDEPQHQMPVKITKPPRLLTKQEDEQAFGGRKVKIQQATTKVTDETSKWSNIGEFLPHTVMAGLDKDAGEAVKFLSNKLLSEPESIGAKKYINDIGLKLEGFGQAHADQAQQNSLPNTTSGQVATSAIGFIPDLLELAATPELDIAKVGKLGEVLTKYGGKYAPKAINMAVGKFPIQQGAKGLVSGYSEAKNKGMDDYDATNHALIKGVEDYGKGILFEGAGAAAGKASDIGKKLLENKGWMAGNKIVSGSQKALLHSAAQATAFSAVPFISNAIQGKNTSLEELKNNAIFGGLMGLFHGESKSGDNPTASDGAAKEALQRSPLIDLNNFMSADIDAVKFANGIEANPTDLHMKAAVAADNAFNDKDKEAQQQNVVTSSTFGKLASVKAVTNAILEDKGAVIASIDDLGLPEEAKQKIIDKINSVHKELDPVEQQKTALGNQISAIDEQLKQAKEVTTDPVKQAENEVKAEVLAKNREETSKQLKQIITKQQENEKVNGEQQNGQEDGQKGNEKEKAGITQKSNEEGSQNEKGLLTKTGVADEVAPVIETESESRGRRAKEDFVNTDNNTPYVLHESNGKVTIGIDEKTVRNQHGLRGGDSLQSHENTEVELTKEEVKELRSIERDKELGDINGLEYSKRKRELFKRVFKRNLEEVAPVNEIKGEPNDAVQKQSTGKMGVRDETAVRSEVGKNDQSKEPANQSEKEINSETKAKEKVAGIVNVKLKTLPVAEHSELNNTLRANESISIKDIKDEQQERNEVGNSHSEAGTNAEAVQQSENDGTRNDGKNRSGESVEGSQGTGGKKTFKKPDKPISLTEVETARKLELRKKFSGTFNDITNIPTLLANKEFREYAGLVLKEMAGDFKIWSKEMIDSVGEKIRPHLEQLHKELTGEPEEKGGKEVKKTILTKRAYEGEVSPEVKKYLEEKGLTRKSFSQEERSKQATNFINEFGDDAAYNAVESGDIDGGLAASVLAQLQIKNSKAVYDFPEGSQERGVLEKQHADYIALMEKKGYFSGEFIGQLAKEYENAELNFASIKRQVEKITKKSLTKEQEQHIETVTAKNDELNKNLKEAESKLIEETDKAFKAGEESAKNETKAEKAKRIADKIRKSAKLSRPGVFSSATPASLVWDGAVEVVAKSIETGGKLADAIDKGIEHIKGTDWYNKLSSSKKSEAESEFKKFHNENTSSTDIYDLQERFLNKVGNKFTNAEARDIWGYMKQTYLDNSTSYGEAISKTAQDLGLSWRQVSEAVVTPKLKRVSDEMWKRTSELARHRSAIKSWIGDQESSAPIRALKKVSGLFRGVAVFAHGHIFLGTHAGMTFFNVNTLNKTIPAFFRGFKLAYGNDADYARSMEELKNSPNYLIAQRAGLKNDPDRINVEEYQKSQHYLGKLGKVGEKGFNTIKVLRQGLFDYHYDKLTPAEKADPEVAKSLAELINLATGATTLKLPSWVNEATFAGGMEASRWQKLLSSPVKAAKTAFNAVVSPEKASTSDRVFAKVWAQRAGGQIAGYIAARTVNAAINNYLNPNKKEKLVDPLNPDWWKFKAFNITIDPTSGMRGTAGFIQGLVKTMYKPSADLHGDSRLAAEAKQFGQYGRGKLAPLYSTISDFVDNRDFNRNLMPKFPIPALNRNDKHGKNHRQLTWAEYSTSKLPLPIAEAFGVFYKSALDHGTSKKTLDAAMNGILSGAISGTTGFRVGEQNTGKGHKMIKLLPKN